MPNTSDTPLLSIPSSPPQSPIFSLLTPYPKHLAAYCQQHGFVVRGIVPPTVPEGAERARICLHAGNTAEEIDGLVDVVGMWAEEWQKQRMRNAGEERARL
jgi:8-amino-7-oxononanoate synthase